LTRRIVATVVVAGAFLWSSAGADARPLIHVVAPKAITGQGAVGLYVPGAGGRASRAGAIASIRRGTVENAALGGKPRGKILVDLVFGTPTTPRRPGVYVTLPPPGQHPNTKRYQVLIVGPGYAGILTAHSTRIRGLVSIADLAPTAVALAEGRSPPIRSAPDRNALAHLRALDARLAGVHHDRGWILVAIVLTMLLLIAVAPRSAPLAGAAAVTASLLLAWGDATRFALALVVMVVLTAALAIAASFRRTLVPWLVAAFFAAFTLVLAVDPELNSLGVFGARPDGGGRFYGIGNQLETLLLPPVLAAAAIAGLRGLLPLAALALVTIGWSKAGADGGGLVVFATAFAVLGLRLRGLALTPKRLALMAVGVVALTFALVGLDAAIGGSSHVTHAVGTGPGSLLGDLGHRLHLSWAIATNKWYRILIFLGCLAVLVLMGTIRPRRTTVDAMLAGLAVSLLVNDTPVDVIGLGALGCLALDRWESVNSRPMRRGALTTVMAVAGALTLLLLAGCGKEGVAKPLAGTVVGTVQAAAPGKAIFIAQGCGSCHTYKPAGPDAQGTIGPDLDKLAQFAKVAKQPEAQFVHDSIVDPEKYTEKGFPKGVMPKSYKSLPSSDLKALVDFLTKPQG
jgi:cytochrome c551/c552